MCHIRDTISSNQVHIDRMNSGQVVWLDIDHGLMGLDRAGQAPRLGGVWDFYRCHAVDRECQYAKRWLTIPYYYSTICDSPSLEGKGQQRVS